LGCLPGSLPLGATARYAIADNLHASRATGTCNVVEIRSLRSRTSPPARAAPSRACCPRRRGRAGARAQRNAHGSSERAGSASTPSAPARPAVGSGPQTCQSSVGPPAWSR
jgi:hypothetical protein